jgi:hypothetical protein
MARRYPLTLHDLAGWAGRNRAPDQALVTDDRGRAVAGTAPVIGQCILLARCTGTLADALTWQQFRDYAGVSNGYEVWLDGPDRRRPVMAVKLSRTDQGRPLLVLRRLLT